MNSEHQDDSGGSLPHATDAATVAVEDAPPKRAPRSRTRKPAAEAVATDTAVATVAAAPVETAKPEQAGAAATGAGAQGPSAGLDTQGEGSDDAQAGAGPDAAPGEGGSRRSRNRRRGRRGGSSGASGGGAGPVEAQTAEPARVEDVGEVFAAVLSGDFDVEPVADEAPAEPAKRVLAPEPEAPKLHKVLAQSGIGSRRDMEQMIADGRVSVNGEPAHVGQRISYGDRIEVAGKPVKVRIAPPPARVIAYHKPAGEVVSHNDPEQRPTVFRSLPRLPHGKWQSVGRLDINTEGLLLFTNSGDLANRLMHPRFGVEREYAARVLGTLSDEARAQLLAGVQVDGQTAAFKSIDDGGGDGANRWYRVVITEGRNREVRKLFEAVGLAVSRLIRIRYGCVVLPRGLRRGVWVDLPEGDVRSLRTLTGADVARDGGSGGGGRPDKQHSKRRDGRRDNRGENRGESRGDNRGDRGDRGDNRGQRPQRQNATMDPNREPGDPGTIPNPLQQTFDRRPLQRERPVYDDDIDGPIPNPLQQTYDRRFVQKQGQGRGGGSQQRGGKGGGGQSQGGQPDPMKTSVGYIGADAFLRKGQGRNRRGGR